MRACKTAILADLDDNELYRLYRDRRDNEAFRELTHRHLPAVRRLARSQVGNAEADDIGQEVFLQLARATQRFNRDCNVVGWIFWLAKGRIKNAQRRMRSAELLTPPCDRSTSPVERNELFAAFQSFTATLSADDHELLTLHLEGVQKQEIARRFGVHRNTIRKSLAGLLEQAADALAEHR